MSARIMMYNIMYTGRPLLFHNVILYYNIVVVVEGRVEIPSSTLRRTYV